jgi:hypothetical protein
MIVVIDPGTTGTGFRLAEFTTELMVGVGTGAAGAGVTTNVTGICCVPATSPPLIVTVAV